MVLTPLVFSDDGGRGGRGCGQKETINGGYNTQHQAEVCAREKQKHGGKRKREKGGGELTF